MAKDLRSRDLTINKLRSIREAEKLTQQQLGSLVGVSRQTINAIERERLTPSLPLALVLAKECRVNVEEIFQL